MWQEVELGSGFGLVDSRDEREDKIYDRNGIAVRATWIEAWRKQSRRGEMQNQCLGPRQFDFDFSFGAVVEELASSSTAFVSNEILLNRLTKSIHTASENFAQWMSVTTLLQDKDKQVLNSLLRIHKKNAGWLSHKVLTGYTSAQLFYSLNTLKFYKWLGNSIKRVETGNERTMRMLMKLLTAPEPPTAGEIKQVTRILRKHKADTRACKEDFSWAFDTAWSGYSLLLDKISLEERRLDERRLRQGVRGSIMLKLLRGLSCSPGCYQLQIVQPMLREERSLDEVLCLDKALTLEFAFPTPMLDLLIRVLRNRAKAQQGEEIDDDPAVGSIQALVEAVKSEEAHFSSLLLQLKQHVMQCFHSVRALHTQILQLQRPLTV